MVSATMSASGGAEVAAAGAISGAVVYLNGVAVGLDPGNGRRRTVEPVSGNVAIDKLARWLWRALIALTPSQDAPVAGTSRGGVEGDRLLRCVRLAGRRRDGRRHARTQVTVHSFVGRIRRRPSVRP